MMKNVAQIILLLVAASTLLVASARESNNTTTPLQVQTQTANPASVYCEQVAGTLSIQSDAGGNQAGTCNFSDGQQCDEWAVLRGECVPDIAVAEPFRWCAQRVNSPVMSGKDQAAALPRALLNPMILRGLVTPSMPMELVKAARWRCMTGDVWVCRIGANLPCDEQADLSKTPSDAMHKFCQANLYFHALPAYVTGRATVYEWTCKNGKSMAGKKFAAVDAAGYLSNIWHQLKP